MGNALIFVILLYHWLHWLQAGAAGTGEDVKPKLMLVSARANKSLRRNVLHINCGSHKWCKSANLRVELKLIEPSLGVGLQQHPGHF